MKCVFAGCKNPGIHQLGVRLRRKNTNAVWAPNCNAYMCDKHGTQGMRMSMQLIPNHTGEIQTTVYGGGTPVTRITAIKRPKQERKPREDRPTAPESKWWE